MNELQNAGAIFVLPSQLNGAEYLSFDTIVSSIDEYNGDPTGGPAANSLSTRCWSVYLDNAANQEQRVEELMPWNTF